MSLLDTLFGVGRRRVNSAAFRRPRASKRVPLEERADLERSKDGTKSTVIVADLSSGGARLSTPMRLAVGEDLTITIAAGRTASFTLGCSVIFALAQRSRRIHNDYGVKFVRIKPGDLERLRGFVAARDDARLGATPFI
jgi:PilZ domain-containing protein